MKLIELKDYADKYCNRFDHNTKTAYSQALRAFFDYMARNGITSLNDVTTQVSEGFKAELEMDFAPKTCNMFVTTIKDFIRYLQILVGDDKINAQFLTIRATTLSSREQKTAVLTEDEVSKLLSTVYNIDDEHRRERYKIMCLLMLNLGLRVDEAVELKLGSIKQLNGCLVVHVVGKGMRHRYITTSEKTASEVMAALNFLGITGPDAYVIQGDTDRKLTDTTKPLNPATVFKRIKTIIKHAGITKRISPHSLRRTCATLLYKKGTPIESIQRILGHENVHTTQRYIDMEVDIEVSAKYAMSLSGEAV